MKVHLGKIALFSGDYVPNKWSPCDGKQMDFAQYSGLFGALSMQGSRPDSDKSGFYLPELADIGSCRHLMCVEGALMAEHVDEQDVAGFILPLGEGEVPRNWALCDGSNLNIQQHPSLFHVVGFKFGKDADTFFLPNLNQPDSERYIICINGDYTSPD